MEQPEGRADEVHITPIDGRVISVATDGDQMIRVAIGIAKEIEPGTVTDKWTGAFTDGGKVIAGSDFKLVQASGRNLATRIAGPKPPSTTVRLFPPGFAR